MGTQKEWGATYTILSALHKISALLWGSILFAFIVTSGFQVLGKIVIASDSDEEEEREKLKPIAHGVALLKSFYLREHPRQLAIILVAADIVRNHQV